jgi:YbgC/YbaW family acyl-CoA thioester hydrolase
MFRYHLRLILLYLRWRLAGKPRGTVSRVPMRASAMDCDMLGHINNARYLELLDCGRVSLFLRLGLFERGRKEGFVLLVGGVNILYRREIRWRTRFMIESRVDRIDGKAIVIKSQMFVGDKVANEAEVNILVVKAGKVVDPSFLFPELSAP